MRKNANVRYVGRNIILVPYKKEHVLRYHEWMGDEELLALTASERLSLGEEYGMQKSWMMDEDKCTFIILDKAVYEATKSEVDAMIGDTNFFFTESDGETIAEAEIMIAEKQNRRKRRGWEAMLLMLRYGCDELGMKKFLVKISCQNTISINMFKKIGFTEVNRSTAFEEVTLQRLVDSEWQGWLEHETEGACLLKDEV